MRLLLYYHGTSHAVSLCISTTLKKTINFKVERGNENKGLLFVHYLIRKSTTVYKKPITIVKYMKLNSYHSSAIRHGFIEDIFLRVERSCSTPDLLSTEEEKIY